jgi:putative DNA primase/helicase
VARDGGLETESWVEEKLIFLYGTGANGKSVFLNVLLKIFGDYGQPTDPDLLVTTPGDHHPTGIADLMGVRLAVSNELEEGQLLREALLKKLTGGDPISARFMHQNFFTFKPTHTLFMAGNHKPIIRGQDEGIWRRILMIPFLYTIPEPDRDRQLMEKLMAEAPGILRWLVEGCLAWQRNGLEIPAEVRYAVGVYREDSDPLADFIEEKCVIHPVGVVTKVELYQVYATWGKENGMPIINQKAFFNLILQKYPQIEQKRSASQRYWQGITLKHSDTMTECDTKINNTHGNNRDEELKIVSSDVIRHFSPFEVTGT